MVTNGHIKQSLTAFLRIYYTPPFSEVSPCSSLYPSVHLSVLQTTTRHFHSHIKMHKNPVKFWFIIRTRNCITKQVAKKLVQILQLVIMIHWKYCNKIKSYTGIQRFWIVESNAQVREDIAFDFSALYTKIPLDDLKEKLKQIVNKAFKGGHNKYNQITARLQGGFTARRTKFSPRKISSTWTTWS